MKKYEDREHDITLAEIFTALAAAKARYQLLFIFIVLFVGGVLGSLWENNRVVPFYQSELQELKTEINELKKS